MSRPVRPAIFCLLGILLLGPHDGLAQTKGAEAPKKKPSAQAKKLPPSALLERARGFESQQRYDQAVAAYRDYLVVRPQDDEARTSLAAILTQQGKLDQAATEYETVLSRHPDLIPPALALAAIRMQQQKFAAAQRAYEQVLRLDPANGGARRGLADALRASGRSAEALLHYELVYQATNDPVIADIIRQINDELKQALGPTTSPQLTPEQILEKAHAAEAAQQYAEAATAYREYLFERPNDDTARQAFAQILASEGFFTEAVKNYERLLANHPNDVELLLALARLSMWQKKAGAARSYYEEVLRVDPRNLEAKRVLAEVAYWAREYGEALSYYDDIYAATRDPEIERRIREIRRELLPSPQAMIGPSERALQLPFRNYVKLGYSHYAYTNGVPDEKSGQLELAHAFGDQTAVIRTELINRFHREDLLTSASFYSPLWKRAWGAFDGSFAANPAFVSNFSVGGQFSQGLGLFHESLSFLETGIGYRHMTYSYKSANTPNLSTPAIEVDVLTPNVTLYLPFDLWLTEKLTYVPQTGAATLTSQLTWRPGERVQVYASGAFGTSGERLVAFQDFTRAETRSYQGGVIFPIWGQVSGEFNGFYEDRGFLYIRRGGFFNLIWHY
ncbi:MAG: tetratricopeptide repeat protein [Nitrospirota bacterium]